MPGPLLEIVTIGDELLLGETVDGNSAWLGRKLAAAGLRVARRTTVGDDDAAIQDAVKSALDRSSVVICTGGLGPTHDDRTRPAVAALFGRELRVDEQVLETLRERFRSRGIEMAAINQVQAEVPAGGKVFPNSRGTAPGLAVEDGDRVVVMLPGVPSEMRGLVEDHVLDYLRSRMPSAPHGIRHRVIRTTGIAESRLAERLADVLPALQPLTIAFLPDVCGVDLRVTCWPDAASGEVSAEDALHAAEDAIRAAAGDYIYGTDQDDLAHTLGKALAERGLTVAFAESCTGGLIAKRMTDVAGSSAYVTGGVVAYANEAKHRVLGVRQATLDSAGAVSEAVAREMADGAQRVFAADTAIAVTGVAGPGGGTEQKPVGTVWIAVRAGERTDARLFRFGGDRAEVRDRSAQAALAMLWDSIRKAGKGTR